jgi:hypothetical protein
VGVVVSADVERCNRSVACQVNQPLSCHAQELLGLEGYLAVEKGNPGWLELPDEAHIWHKALYDGLSHALSGLYADAGRVLPAPGEVRCCCC